MRRAVFVQLVGMTDESFNVLRGRKLVPLRGQKPIGWQDYSVDDALALEIASSLAHAGLSRKQACLLVDDYYNLALERAEEQKPKRTRRDILVGSALMVGVESAKRVEGDSFPLVGIAGDVADQIDQITAAIPSSTWLVTSPLISMNFCFAVIKARAEQAKIDDARIGALKKLFHQ